MSAGRKYLTPKQTAALRLAQGDLCACGCGRPLGEKIIREHTLPNFFKPGKPDALWRAECAAEKTSGEAGWIAKTRRMAGETGQQKRRAAGKTKKIPVRKFPETQRKMVSRSFPQRTGPKKRARQPDHPSGRGPGGAGGGT